MTLIKPGKQVELKPLTTLKAIKSVQLCQRYFANIPTKEQTQTQTVILYYTMECQV